MADTITTGTEVEIPTIEFPQMPAPTDGAELRPAMVGVLARAQEAERAALARVAELERQLNAARSEQITDGADPRLIEFWERAGRIADHADFCQEYDRLAEAMNGTPRERDWTVTMELSITVTVDISVSATTGEDAEDNARDLLDTDAIVSAIQYRHYDVEVEEISAERD